MKPVTPPPKSKKAPAPKRPFRVSWIVAGMVAVLGTGLLGGAVFYALRKPETARPVATSANETQTQAVEKQIEAAEAELAALREKNKPFRTEYETLAAANKATEERTAKREKRVKEQEAFNRERISNAQRKIEEIKNQETQDTANADKLIAQKAEAEKQLQQFQQDVLKLREAIVTVVSSGGTIGTGFFYSTPDGPVIVTTSDVAPEDAQVAVNIRRTVAGKARYDSVKAKMLLCDKDAGLSILRLDKPEDIKGALFDENFMRDAQAGESLYAIATQVINGRPVDFSIFDGTVSATNRKHKKRNTLQVALPVNLGSRGAPLITPDMKLVGILLEPVDDLEKTSVAVPAKELLKAIERLPKKK